MWRRWRCTAHRPISSMPRCSDTSSTASTGPTSSGGRAVVLCSEGRHSAPAYDFGASGRPPIRPRIRSPLRPGGGVGGRSVAGGGGCAGQRRRRAGWAWPWPVTSGWPQPASRFSANFARLGLHPGFGLSATLPRVVGEQQGARPALLRPPYRRERGPCASACAMRLADDPRAGAHALAEEIAASAPLAVRCNQGNACAPSLTGELRGGHRARAPRAAAADGDRRLPRGHRGVACSVATRTSPDDRPQQRRQSV